MIAMIMMKCFMKWRAVDGNEAMPDKDQHLSNRLSLTPQKLGDDDYFA